VAPKREALRAAQGELAETMGQLAEAQAKLKAVEEKMEVLQAQYMEATAKKEGLAKQVRACGPRVLLLGCAHVARVRWGGRVVVLLGWWQGRRDCAFWRWGARALLMLLGR